MNSTNIYELIGRLQIPHWTILKVILRNRRYFTKLYAEKALFYSDSSFQV